MKPVSFLFLMFLWIDINTYKIKRDARGVLWAKKGAIFLVCSFETGQISFANSKMYIQKARHPLYYKIILIFTRPSTWQASWYCGIQTCSFDWNPAIKIFSKDSQLVLGSPLALELSSAAAGIGSDPFQIENWTPAVLVRVQNLEYLHRRRGQRGVMRLSCAPGEWVTIYSPQDRGGGSEYNLEYNSIAV